MKAGQVREKLGWKAAQPPALLPHPLLIPIFFMALQQPWSQFSGILGLKKKKKKQTTTKPAWKTLYYTKLLSSHCYQNFHMALPRWASRKAPRLLHSCDGPSWWARWNREHGGHAFPLLSITALGTICNCLFISVCLYSASLPRLCAFLEGKNSVIFSSVWPSP